MEHADLEARRRAAEVLRERFLEIVEQMRRGEKPVLVMPKRTLSNTIYDVKRRMLLLGPDKIKRSFLDLGEAKRFMQTLLMASIIYEALVNDEYPTIRDLYYRGKHTLKGRENTWDTQRESDAAIRDVESYTGLLREEMLILSKEKGKVVGRMRIRSGGDVIDLSRMGHGAYSIEPTPDQIEFLDVDAEYVLVIEKDAVFQQLHRIRFWDTHRALLVTSAGQPDRATRRFVRRLSDELRLPVYVLTDSIPADEVVVVRRDGRVQIGPVEELVGGYFSGLDRERVEAPLEVLSWNPATGEISWKPIAYAYRHRVAGPLLRIRTRGRGDVRVTKAHSLFVVKDGEVRVLPAEDIRPGDRIVVAGRTPRLGDPSAVFQELLGGEGQEASYSTGDVVEAKRVFLALQLAGADPLVEGSGASVSVRVGASAGASHEPPRLGSATTVVVEEIVEEEYEGYVYDFAVPGTNSFIGGFGIVYHNSDPYGWYIYSVFKIGSVTLSYESERLATPEAKFIGVMPSDIFGDEVLEKYSDSFVKLLGKRGLRRVLTGKSPLLSPRERRSYVIRAKPSDVLRAIELVGVDVYAPFRRHVEARLRLGGRELRELRRKEHAGYDWFKTPEWIREVGIFFATLSKLEIEALTSKGLRFLAFKYIPEKIETGDWIE